MSTTTEATPGARPISAPDATPTPPDGRLGALRRYAAPLAAFGTAKLIGFAVFMYLVHASHEFRHKNPRYGGGHHPWDVLASWDGWWYQQVAQFGYHPQLIQKSPTGMFNYVENSSAFFPLYPGLMRLVSECTGLGLYGAGLVVSVVSSFVAAAGIYAVTAKIGNRKAGVIAAILWAIFPGSGVEWALYSDSLFVALAAWACYCVITRRWIAAGVITLVAGLNRPTASALIAGLGIAGLVALFQRKDGILKPLFAMAIAPLGLFGYVGWVGWKMGDWTGYFTLQKGAWAHFFDGGKYTYQVVHDQLTGHLTYMYQYGAEDFIGMMLLIAVPVLLLMLFRLRPPVVLVVYTLVTIVMVLGSQGIFGNVSRYFLPAFPLFVPLAIALRRASWPMLVTSLGVLAAASGWYAGFVLFEIGIP